MVYIVHGATGAQGSPVLAALRMAGISAVAAVRDMSRVPAGTQSLAVDLSDRDSLIAAYAGAAGVFIHLPMGDPDQIASYAASAASAVRAARPDRVVISTSGEIVDQPGSPLQAEPGSPIMTLIRAVEESGVSTAVVAPRLFLENLLLPVVAGHAREAGILRYPLPASFPVSWSSHLDVADVACRLLTDRTLTGVVAVGHLPGLTGSDLAAAFAGPLDRDVRFEALTPRAFGDLITPIFGADASTAVVDLYALLNTQDGNSIDPDTSAQRLLGIAPRPVTTSLGGLI